MASFEWPSAGGGSGSDPSVGPNGDPIPGDSTLVGGENPSGNLQPLQTNAAGSLIVTPDPTSLTNVNITEYGSVATTLGQKVSASSIPVVIASDDTVAISAASLPLPTGASTSSLQTTGNTSLASILANQTNGTQVTAVNNFPATQPVSGTVAVTQSTSPWVDNISQFGGSAVSLGSKVSASSMPVVIASDQGALPLPTGAATSALQSSTQGATGGGTAATAATLVGGVYNPSQTTISTGQQIALQTDNLGRLQVTFNSNTATTNTLAATPAALTIHQAAVTVGTTAVRLTVTGSAPNSSRVVLVATPDSATAASVVFYIGSSTVTNSSTTRGVEIGVGQSFIANNDAGDYWIIASAASQTVTIMEQY